MTDMPARAALVTGASGGIGAAYAERLARRGHDLVLVARNHARMDALAARLRAETGVAVETMAADLTVEDELAAIERRLREDARIGLLVNNAGTTVPGGFVAPDLDLVERLIRLNVTSVARLAGAVVPRFVEMGGGAIVNVSSVLAIGPERAPGIYPATKAFVLAFSQSLQSELGPRGIYVQVVMPSATRSGLWAAAGIDVGTVQNLMEAGDLVDAALLGFDRREAVTIPPLHDIGQWERFSEARRAMLTSFPQGRVARRYHS